MYKDGAIRIFAFRFLETGGLPKAGGSSETGRLSETGRFLATTADRAVVLPNEDLGPRCLAPVLSLHEEAISLQFCTKERFSESSETLCEEIIGQIK